MGDRIDKVLKRGKYKKQECPYCHNHYGNLQNHINMKHPNESLAKKDEPPALTADQVLGKEKVPPAPDKPWDVDYICNDCHAEIRKGETRCWNCGKTLNWEGIE